LQSLNEGNDCKRIDASKEAFPMTNKQLNTSSRLKKALNSKSHWRKERVIKASTCKKKLSVKESSALYT